MPTKDTLDKLDQLIRHRGASRAYFFDSLKSPSWVRPLVELGYFCKPPEPQEEGNSLLYARWPESQYLARVAGLAPSEVLAAIRRVPETKNIRVHRDLVRASIAMPASHAGFVVEDRLTQWVSFLEQFGFARELSQLAIHLVNGGQAAMGLRLVEAVLSLRPGTEEPPTNSSVFVDEPVGAVSAYDYGEILRSFVSPFSRSAGLKWIQLLVQNLRIALEAGRGSAKDTCDDYSHIWFPQIDEVPRETDGVRNLLVAALRESCEIVLDDNRDAALDVLELLQSRTNSVFHRLYIHLVATRATKYRNEALNAMKNRSYFEGISYRGEYQSLVTKVFPSLEPTDRQHYFEMVGEKPDFREIKGQYERLWGREIDDEEMKRDWREAQLRRLVGLEEFLSPDLRSQFDRWIAEFGRPATIVHRHRASASWVGERSPMSVDELARLSDDALARFLAEWEPPDEVDGASISGLAGTFTNLVRTNPARVVSILENLKSTRPTFCYSVLTGFQGAVKEGGRIDWSPILGFARWAISRINGKEFQEEWRGCRTAVLDLIVSGIEGGEPALPIEHRDEVWSCIEVLLRDPDPTPERDAKLRESESSPLTTAINSVRGRALEAAIRFALWIRIHQEKSKPEEAKQGFAPMPEVAKALEEHLHIERDPSIALRAIYGAWTPQLAMLDRVWFERNAEQIFPDAAPCDKHRMAAWNAYIAFCRPYTGVFRILREEYEWAVNRLPEIEEDRFGEGHPRRSLAEHLMHFYVVGEVDWDSELIKSFWSKAPGEIRRFVVAAIGRGLPNADQPVKQDAIERLKSLCERRITFVKGVPGKDKPDYSPEIAEFGWWFGSSHFELSWTLARLKEVLDLTGGEIQRGKELMARLSSSFHLAPKEIVECVEQMLKSGDKNRNIDYWSDEIKAVLLNGIRSENRDASRVAKGVQDWLLKMDYREFRQLE